MFKTIIYTQGLSIVFWILCSTGQTASVQYGEGKKDQKNDENMHQQRYLLAMDAFEGLYQRVATIWTSKIHLMGESSILNKKLQRLAHASFRRKQRIPTGHVAGDFA